MTKEELNEWAAQYAGEDSTGVEDAVAADWYTDSPGSAFAILHKCALDGKKVEITLDKGITAKVGDSIENGPLANAGEVMITAAYNARG